MAHAGSIGYLEMRGCCCGPGANAFAFLPSAYGDLRSTEHLPQQKQRGPGNSRASFLRRRVDGLVVHPAHAAARHCRSCGLLLRHFGDHSLRGDQQAGDRSRILQGAPHDLRWVDDTLAHQVAVLARLRIVAVRILVLVHDLADHDRAVSPGIDCDLAGRGLDRLAHDLDAVLLVLVLGLEVLECLDRTQ